MNPENVNSLSVVLHTPARQILTPKLKNMVDEIRSVPLGFMRGWLVALGVSLSLVVLASLPPFVSEGMRSFIMDLFAGVCHQLEDRSAHVNDISLAVCHRCFGAYVGLPAAALLFGSVKGAWPFTPKTAPYVLLVAALPALVDWGGDILGIWINTGISRSVTGFIMGIGAGYFLVAAIVDGFTHRAKRSRTTPHRQSLEKE